MKTITINAPKYYGNAMCWALGQLERLIDEGNQVVKCEPIVNNSRELVAIKVTIK